MISQITMEIIDGARKKVQTIQYSNGLKTRRVFNRVGDVVPATVEILNKGFSKVIQKGKAS